MYQLTIFKLLCVATITSATQLEPGIAKGNCAGRGHFPSIVAIRNIKDNAHICTGIIVNQFWALTTTHCIYKKGRSVHRPEQDIFLISNTLTTNTSEGKNHSIEKLESHSFFDPDYDDLLLIKVKEEFYPKQSPIADILNQFSCGYVGKFVIAASWGRESENSTEFSTRLNKYTTCITVLSKNEICDNSYIFCAKAVDDVGTCIRDCGEPVFDQTGQTLLGIIAHIKGCTPGEVEQIIKIEPYKQWIWDVTREKVQVFEI